MKHYVRNNQATHFIVVSRRCEVYEPSWVVVREGSGQTAQSLAHFFNEFDANEYAKWRNEIQQNVMQHG